jgi:hypothetical protein
MSVPFLKRALAPFRPFRLPHLAIPLLWFHSGGWFVLFIIAASRSKVESQVVVDPSSVHPFPIFPVTPGPLSPSIRTPVPSNVNQGDAEEKEKRPKRRATRFTESFSFGFFLASPPGKPEENIIRKPGPSRVCQL